MQVGQGDSKKLRWIAMERFVRMHVQALTRFACISRHILDEKSRFKCSNRATILVVVAFGFAYRLDKFVSNVYWTDVNLNPQRCYPLLHPLPPVVNESVGEWELARSFYLGSENCISIIIF